ncbi:MAG: tRNA pseudouridine(38-40) synthase TruA [Pseudomonadota bacterium]
MVDLLGRFSTEPLPAGSRIACRIEYDGRSYQGWQWQPQQAVNTVQNTLQSALSKVADQNIELVCAGRTDAGVHAFAQVVHFETAVARSPKAWVIGANANLPADVRVHWAVPVSSGFHARFSALSRRYRYVIANTAVRPAQFVGQLTWQRRRLDHLRMHEAAQALLGERDFSAFRAASCQSRTPMRNVQRVGVSRQGDLVVIDIQANAFLHHMVRNIAGSLMVVGTGLQDVDWISQLLAGRDRTLAAETAVADGLYLVDVVYPKEFDLPAAPYGPLLLRPNGETASEYGDQINPG